MVYMFDIDRYVDDQITSVSVKNKGLNYGLGYLDGIRGFWNDNLKQLFVFRLDDHLRRFYKSGHSLQMPSPYSVDELTQITRELLILNEVYRDVYIRPICFKGSNTLRPDLIEPFNHLAIFNVFTEYEPKPVLRTCISSWTRVGSNMIPPQVKPTAGYLNSALAISEAEQNGFDEAIFLTDEGNVSEGATENIFIVQGRKVYTPPVSDDILPGITRDTVMQIITAELGLPVIVQSFTRIELYEADEVFFTGTAVGIKPVVEVDRRVIANGEPGPVTLEVLHIYNRMIRGELPGYRHYCFPVY
ncbi:branched-chain-amino-acid transaminase [Thalassobacillus sp. CUG 92003]|uniref:branched-chain-amino-acid transaminase n=1 Tax=Thalassobacillus sp. CUG 92003 TaxID=2736641 RepID=UPI0015E65169|nr:branched-chain-amino-acid transaminase [Thalassobacillus sp. CUG 92003]